MSSRIYVVVGGQYGSEGKGAVAGRICADEATRGGVVCVRVGGPNAGHTVLGKCPPPQAVTNPEECGDVHEVDKHPWRLRQVPVAAVTATGATLVIAAGSEIDPYVLADEVRELETAGYDVARRLIIDRSATVLTPAHIKAEQVNGINARLGSTAKGIGAARSERIWRQALTWEQWVRAGATPGDMELTTAKRLQAIAHADTSNWMAEQLKQTQTTTVVIEGTQGYGLGLHTPEYPQVTSGDCRAIDFLGSAGLSPWMSDADGWGMDLKVVIAVRPHPIRVAGNSGHLAGETTWEALGLPAERTTVTNKIRRVGAWDAALVRAAIRANGGPREGVVYLALTMMDSCEPKIAGIDHNTRSWANVPDGAHGEILFDTVQKYLSDLGVGVQHLGYVGTGPDTAVVNNRMYD